MTPLPIPDNSFDNLDKQSFEDYFRGTITYEKLYEKNKEEFDKSRERLKHDDPLRHFHDEHGNPRYELYDELKKLIFRKPQ